MNKPLATNERNAAKMLDLKTFQFRDLVEKGHLPPPKKIGPHERWLVADIEAVLTGAVLDDEVVL